MDKRIHFALNCGAKSCPPIKLFSPDTLEEGLQSAATAFLQGSGFSLELNGFTNSFAMLHQRWYNHWYSVLYLALKRGNQSLHWESSAQNKVVLLLQVKVYHAKYVRKQICLLFACRRWLTAASSALNLDLICGKHCSSKPPWWGFLICRGCLCWYRQKHCLGLQDFQLVQQGLWQPGWFVALAGWLCE